VCASVCVCVCACVCIEVADAGAVGAPYFAYVVYKYVHI